MKNASKIKSRPRIPKRPFMGSNLHHLMTEVHPDIRRKFVEHLNTLDQPTCQKLADAGFDEITIQGLALLLAIFLDRKNNHASAANKMHDRRKLNSVINPAKALVSALIKLNPQTAILNNEETTNLFMALLPLLTKCAAVIEDGQLKRIGRPNFDESWLTAKICDLLDSAGHTINYSSTPKRTGTLIGCLEILYPKFGIGEKVEIKTLAESGMKRWLASRK